MLGVGRGLNESLLHNSAKPSSRIKPRLVAAAVVLLIVFNSVGQAEYTRAAYRTLQFNSYYFLCWFTNSWRVACFPVFLIFSLVHARISHACQARAVGQFTLRRYFAWLSSMLYANPKFTWRRYLLVSLPLTLFSYFGSYAWYASLDMIPVSINSAMFKSVVLFVFLLSIFVVHETITVIKVLALVVCVGGVCCVGVGNYWTSGGGTPTNYWLGYVLVLIGALLTACFAVLYQRQIGEANIYGVMLLQSLIGLYTLVMLWVLVPVFFYAHVEPFVSFTTQVVEFLFVNAAFATSYYALYGFGISYTTAVYMNICTMLTIPVAGVADYLFHRDTFNWMTILGFCLVFVGVIVVNLQSWRQPGKTAPCCQACADDDKEAMHLSEGYQAD